MHPPSHHLERIGANIYMFGQSYVDVELLSSGGHCLVAIGDAEVAQFGHDH